MTYGELPDFQRWNFDESILLKLKVMASETTS